MNGHSTNFIYIYTMITRGNFWSNSATKLEVIMALENRKDCVGVWISDTVLTKKT